MLYLGFSSLYVSISSSYPVSHSFNPNPNEIETVSRHEVVMEMSERKLRVSQNDYCTVARARGHDVAILYFKESSTGTIANSTSYDLVLSNLTTRFYVLHTTHTTTFSTISRLIPHSTLKARTKSLASYHPSRSPPSHSSLPPTNLSRRSSSSHSPLPKALW